MKQQLLTFGAMLLAVSSFAQSRTNTQATKIARPTAPIDVVNENTAPSRGPVSTQRNNGQNSVNAITFVPTGGSSANSYGGFVATKHQFAYDPASNLLVFGHRAGGAMGGGSFQMAIDVSSDGGATWTGHQMMTNPGNTEAVVKNMRYPNTSIYNPQGSSNPADCKVVMTGPCTSGAGWNASFLQSANLPAGTSPMTSFSTATAGQTPDQLDFASWHLIPLNGGFGYVSARMDVAAQTQSYHTVDFFKIVPDGMGGFTRSVKYSSVPVALAAPADTASFGFDLAFGPDGNTGYMTHMTCDFQSQTPAMYGRSPIIYKTSDAGETWTKLGAIDWSRIQMIMDSTFTPRLYGASQPAGQERPTLTESRSTVDNVGRLHIFGLVSSGACLNQDSLGFTLTSGGVPLSFFAHFIVDGSSVSANFLRRMQNAAGTYGALGAAFDEQMQIGRSADGTHIFGTFLETPVAGTVVDNNAPNLWMYGYRTSDDKVMPPRDMTTGTDVEASVFFSRLTPVVRSLGGGSFNLPIVTMTPGTAAGAIDPAAPVEFTFISDINATAADFTDNGAVASPGALWSTAGTNVFDPTSTSGQFVAIEVTGSLEQAVSFMPNPTSGELRVNLTALTSAATITVADATGRVVLTQTNQTGNATVDMSNQANGIYFVTVKSNTGFATAKISVIK